MKIRIIFLLLTVMLGFNVEAQTKPEEFVKTFFENFENEGASVALNKLYSTNDWIKRNEDAITNLKSQLEGLNKDFVGEYYGYELLVEKKSSESYVLLSYLVKYDRQPVRFIFKFYKPNKDWKIYGFKFDGDIGAEVEEAAKLYYHSLD